MNSEYGQRSHDERPADGTEPSERTGPGEERRPGETFPASERTETVERTEKTELRHPSADPQPSGRRGGQIGEQSGDPLLITARLPFPGTAPATGPATAAATGPAPTGKVRRGIRGRTVVFGLILLVISTSTLITLLSSVRVDGTAVTVAVLIGAGALLVVGGLAAAVRETRGGPSA